MSKRAGPQPTTDDKEKQTKTPADPPEDKKIESDDEQDDKTPPAKKEKTFTKAELDAAAKKAVEEARKKWEEEKDLSELERLKKQNEELLAGLRLRDAKEEVIAALTAAGNKSPELAFQALKAELKFDDAGKLINTKDLIDGLKTNYPEQFGEAKPGETIDGGAGQEGKGEKLTPEKLAAMTPDEINKLDWNEVKAVMETAK